MLTDDGLYVPGTTLLHRLDARVKVLSALSIIMLCFAATTWGQLLFIAFVSGLALWILSPVPGSVWRVPGMLRWLYVFTILMHLLLSPGRTLWGSSWLSLDGLLTGIYVCVQMLLSVLIASTLAVTTSTEALIGTFGWLVKPLRSVGCQTQEWQKTLLLAIGFIPSVRQEAMVAVSGHGPGDNGRNGKSGRWATWTSRLQDFMMRIVQRGDAIAHELVEDSSTLELPAEPAALFPLARHDRSFCLVLVVMLACYWFIG